MEELLFSRGNSGLWGSDLQTILTRASRLRLLCVTSVTSRSMIAARDIISSKWATASLKYIDIQIRVPRADEDVPPDSPALHASRDLQR
ncbi:hypothetical protein DFQ27_000124 [Actinomortierella ambigua]|uniref:Uncharacterized protein n=1 Tax=Actinomortierella ambigua TaxID=1343610 RepID=A0A9P6QFN0_9FUNG|nr:hypothetical protein DFQ27_000124 [Actinomortierella ambigua]